VTEAPWVEEAELYAEAAAEVYNRLLQPIDGVRGTWKWMLEHGSTGYGLMPYICDVNYWDNCWSVWQVTHGEPLVLPALVEWVAPELEAFHHFEAPVPLVHINGGRWPGDDHEFGTSWMNFAYDEECSIRNQCTVAAAPVWSITPINVDTYLAWENLFKDMFRHVDGHVVASILHDDEGWHHEYVDQYGKEQDCDDIRYQLVDGEPVGCQCGLEQEQQRVADLIYSGALWPAPFDLPGDFLNTWSWTTQRWASAWNAIWQHQNIIESTREGEPCLSSWASSRSPYCRTLDSDALTLEIERLSLIPLTNSQPSQESLPEPSPQLTLFGM
jgi:hypothetical protein